MRSTRTSDATKRWRSALASQSSAELIRALDDPSPEVARAAIHRLAEVDPRSAATALRARLLDADPSLAAEIATVLRGLGDAGVTELAIAGLRGEPYSQRVAAARALTALGERRAIDELRAALRDEIAAVRVASLDALAQIAHGEGVGRDCARLLADTDALVRTAAVRAVARTAPRAGTMLATAAADPDRVVRVEVARHLAGLPERVATALLTDPDLRVREAAVQAAGAGQTPLLAAILADDPAGDVRRAAARTLGTVGDARAAELLVRGIDDSDAMVRAAVLRALERLLTRAGAIRRLRRELQSPQPLRRRAGLYALARLNADGADLDLQRLVGDIDPDVRLALVHTADALMRDPTSLTRRLAADPDFTVRHAAEMWLLRTASADQQGKLTYDE